MIIPLSLLCYIIWLFCMFCRSNGTYHGRPRPVEFRSESPECRRTCSNSECDGQGKEYG